MLQECARYRLPPCGSLLRREVGGEVVLEPTEGQRGSRHRWIQLSRSMKGRQMWFPTPASTVTGRTASSGRLTSLSPAFVICRMLVMMLPQGRCKAK